jgi:uncharacterized protein DUF4917
MKFEELRSYQQVTTHLNQQKRTKHLLFGNGFSMAYDPGIFSYNALSTFIENVDDDLLKKLFSSLNTKNFELIMQQLDNFCEIAEIFSTDKELVNKIKNASEKLKTSLMEAVKELHPEHVFTIPEEKSKFCFKFLDDYLSNRGFVFSTNYDLLLYWVLMRNDSMHAMDGFGRDVLNYSDEYIQPDQLEYSELRWGKNKKDQTIYYLHGTLPLFDTGIEIIKEEYDSHHYLLDNIKDRMEKKEYPILVTAGNAKEKLTHIMHNKYLSYCFDKFSSIEGSLITFGFNFGEYDTHIIDAINAAAHQGRKDTDKRLWSVYIGVYSETDLEHINAIIKGKRIKCKVTPYNAKTASIWG